MEYYCKIRWNDTNKEEFKTIAVGKHDEKDENVFFECSTEHELLNLMYDDNGKDFVVVTVNGGSKTEYELMNKEFRIYGASKHYITRGDYEGLPCPMKAWDWTDDKMAELADKIDSVFSYESYPTDETLQEELESEFWLAMENEAVQMGMTYYEDMTREEYDADKKEYKEYLEKKAKIDNSKHLLCNAVRQYRKTIKEALKDGKERKLSNGYDEYEEQLEISVVDDNGTGVDTYQLDKVRYDSESDSVKCHVVIYNYRIGDYWIDTSLLGNEELYLFKCIIF